MGIYSLLLTLVLVLGSPFWLVRMATSGRYRAGLGGRLGRIPAELRNWRKRHTAKPVVWLHAVSVGEVLVAVRLIEEFRQATPELMFAVSTTTAAGQELAKRRLPGCAVFYMPLDFRFAVRRYLQLLAPRLVVLMESELWPRLLVECGVEGIPVAVANARISDRSFPRYMRLRRLWRPLLAEVRVFLAQNEETGERLRAIGGATIRDRVVVTGNVKYDARSGADNAMAQRIGSLLRDTRLVVAGSTLGDEEAMLLEQWPAIQAAIPNVALLIAPRHTNRFEEVAAAMRQSGSPFLRCSQIHVDPELIGETAINPIGETVAGGTILLLDTIGDLGSIYRLATVAFVGGSLVRRGGHNPLEPAQFGVPVTVGPSFENFREIVGKMEAAEGIRIVTDKEGLKEILIELLADPEKARASGQRGKRVFEEQQGATARTVHALLELIA